MLVPTYEHGPLLTLAAESALGQTVEAIEVFIVCDGATEDTLKAAEALVEADDRVRVFVNEKGPRHGEIHRHAALQEASGAIVCYLADDDLWLPNHVANMASLLETADFAHSFPIGFRADGRLYSWPGNFTLPASVQGMREGRNFFPLSCAAHTMELYQRLPHGWRTSPADTPTDIYMWSQVLSVEGVRLASGNEPTVLHFSSRIRGDLSIEDRFEELESWALAASAPSFRTDLEQQIRKVLTNEWAGSAAQNRTLTQQLGESEDRHARLEAELEQSAAETQALEAEREALLADLEGAKGELTANTARLQEAQDRSAIAAARIETLGARAGRLEGQLDSATRSRTWRTRAAVLRIPGVAWLARKAGGVRSR